MTKEAASSKQITDWASRATLCELLSFSLHYPDMELIAAITSGEYAEALAEIAAANGLSCDTTALEVYKDAEAEAMLHTLRAEATRLFIGTPEPAVSPYEGVWAAHDNGVQPLLFVNPKSMEVERFMHACGVTQKEGTNEPLDHIATEFELLQYLASIAAGLATPLEGVDIPGGAEVAYQSFFDEHILFWVDRFAAKLAEETRLPYYRVLADVLAKFATK